MVKNVSDSAMTVKNMFATFSSDSWSVDKILEYCIYDNGDYAMEVQYANILDKYRDYFENSTNGYIDTVKVPSKYYNDPSGFAEYYYGNAGLWFIVLYFAKIQTALDFNESSITVLRYDALNALNKLFLKYADEISDSKNDPTTFSGSETNSSGNN